MAQSREGRLLVAGVEDGRAFVARLATNGAVDPGFDSADIAATMTRVTALAIDADDGVVVAGRGQSGVAGVMVARLLPDGTLDGRFGNAGTTWIDLPNNGDGLAVANDVAILAGGEVLVAGGVGSRPFVARLLASDGGDGPGVLGILRPSIHLSEDAGQSLLTVRRMGGRAGAIEVSYRTRAAAGAEFQATEGEDYTAVSGQLYWPDGDASDRQIIVPIAPDGGSPEEQESFQVELQEATGGAGLGSRVATIDIEADGAPAGLLAISALDAVTAESSTGLARVQVRVQRKYYATGAVSATVTPVSGTAVSGQDFAGEPVTVSWGDGETEEKLVEIQIKDDAEVEQTENFSIQLSAATGGAVIGPRSTVAVTIADDDQAMPHVPPSSPPPAQPSGGGGRTGWLSVLLLGLGGLARSRFCRAS
jgi:hypothetical protein